MSILLTIALYIPAAALINILLPYHKRLVLLSRLNHYTARILCVLLRLKKTYEQDTEAASVLRGKKGALIAANHISYLDIILIGSLFPCVFITSFDITQYGLPSLLARVSGSLMVNRSNPSKISNDIERIQHCMKSGVCTVLFPEATTGNGNSVLPFHSPLFQTVISSDIPVLPLTIFYINCSDRIAWYGDMPFAGHFLKLLFCPEPIPVRMYADKLLIPDTRTTRKDLCRTAERIIRSHFTKLGVPA